MRPLTLALLLILYGAACGGVAALASRPQVQTVAVVKECPRISAPVLRAAVEDLP